jgi:hypothetical protein
VISLDFKRKFGQQLAMKAEPRRQYCKLTGDGS